MIQQETIDRILAVADIKEVVGEYLTLKKRGTTFHACCPFHSEKTPSFTVFPNTGTYKCFGCGKQGNVVGFLMEHENLTFPEALKVLAHKYNIDIQEKEQTPQEIQEHKMRESMWIANRIVADEYARQLLAKENKAARDYAYGRWGEYYCKQVGIGYCPRNARLIDSLGISQEVSETLHLKNRGGYDFFGGRITIPILDRMQRVIGFTARAFDTESEAKYMNSMDSPIYSKSKSVFGVNLAMKEAAKSERFYLVEGAPDCMRLQSIGVYNAVATLGTAWTDDHFTFLKRAASHLCFLPDADPPKEGEQFGPGIKAVMKSGETAMRHGFSVSVKQIPITEEKQDPDTYCQNRNIFNAIEEKDFILWLADNLFCEGMTTEQQGKEVSHIASILACIEDDTTIEMYLGQLVKYGQTKSVWRKAIDKQRKAKAEADAKEKQDKEAGLFKKYGFNVEGNKYYSVGDKGYYEWSNFTMQPLFHIKDAVMPKRIYILKNVFNVEELVELKQEDLVSISKFKQRVEGLGNFIWMATERELTKLKMYLYEKTETAIQITQLGWQRQGFFAFGNGIYFDEKFMKVDDYGIVRLPDANFYLPANSKIYRDDAKLFQFERKFVHLGLSSISLKEFSDQIFLVFGDNGRIGFMYFLATLFRDIVTRETRSFPILNLFGPKGSGKSELGHTLMSFFEIDNVPPNIQNSTLPALNDTVAAVANALVHIDEYKNDLDINKHEFLKGLWDGTGRTRMNMDLDKKKETTSVDSGVILSGQEMPTADIALFSRLIFLSFDKSEFTEEQKANYIRLRQMRSQGMSHLTLQLISMRKKVEKDFPMFYEQTMTDLNTKLHDIVVEDRILLNWLSPLAVFRCLESTLSISLSYKQMMAVSVQGIIKQNSECKQNNELAAFWNMVQFLASDGEIMESGDYRIDYLRRLKTDTVNANWSETKPVLYIQKSRIFMLYKKHGKAVGDTLLPEGSLKYYLEHSREYLGEKPGIRYKVFRKGLPVYDDKEKDAKGGLKEKSTVQRSYCFDYNMLCQSYSINLECAKESDGDTAHQEDFDAEHPKQPKLNFDDDK